MDQVLTANHLLKLFPHLGGVDISVTGTKEDLCYCQKMGRHSHLLSECIPTIQVYLKPITTRILDYRRTENRSRIFGFSKTRTLMFQVDNSSNKSLEGEERSGDETLEDALIHLGDTVSQMGYIIDLVTQEYTHPDDVRFVTVNYQDLKVCDFINWFTKRQKQLEEIFPGSL